MSPLAVEQGLDPLLAAPALWLLGLDALAILVVWFVARRADAAPWGGVTLRILAALGLVVPGWTVFGWYRDLSRAREWARDVPIRTEPIVEGFVVNSVTLISLGFVVLVGGIYLARRLPGPETGAPASEAER